MKKSIPLPIAKRVIEDTLFPEDVNTLRDFTHIIIDLDSVFSVLLYLDDNPDEDTKLSYLDVIVNHMGRFINLYQHKCFINIYYNMNEYKYFPSIYENWCKERIKRYKTSGIVKLIEDNLIKRLPILEKHISNFKFIKCEDSPILTIMKDIENIKDKIVIISRDTHYQCLFLYSDENLYLSDGKRIFNKKTINDSQKGYFPVSYSLIPYFYLLCGDKRNEYKGIRGMGVKTTYKYIKDNLVNIAKDKDEKINSLKEYRPLFFLKEKKQQNDM